MNLDQLQQDKITKQLSILYAVNIWTAKGEQITNKGQTNYKQKANKLQTKGEQITNERQVLCGLENYIGNGLKSLKIDYQYSSWLFFHNQRLEHHRHKTHVLT
jgi:hypothetical protein